MPPETAGNNTTRGTAQRASSSRKFGSPEDVQSPLLERYSPRDEHSPLHRDEQRNSAAGSTSAGISGGGGVSQTGRMMVPPHTYDRANDAWMRTDSHGAPPLSSRQEIEANRRKRAYRSYAQDW